MSQPITNRPDVYGVKGIGVDMVEFGGVIKAGTVMCIQHPFKDESCTMFSLLSDVNLYTMTDTVLITYEPGSIVYIKCDARDRSYGVTPITRKCRFPTKSELKYYIQNCLL